MDVYQIYIFFVDMAKFLHHFMLGYGENFSHTHSNMVTYTWTRRGTETEREREVESYMRVFDWDTFCMTNATVDPFSLFIDVQICVVSSSLFPLGTFYHSRLK